LAYLLIFLWDKSSAKSLTHGHDHYGNYCGFDANADKGYTYFPDLHNDFINDPTLRRRYGVCVASCPVQGATIDDYGDAKRYGRSVWFAALPSFSIAGRCIPYDPPPNYTSATELCAYPPCDVNSPLEARHVCGLQRDDTSRYWLLTEPDPSIIEGWKTEEANESEIEARIAVTKETVKNQTTQALCEVKVLRDTRVVLKQRDSQAFLEILTKYTGMVFRWGSSVYRERNLVLLLGLGGAMVWSFVVIMLFTFCIRLILYILILLFFSALIIADYFLFVQAGILTGRTGGHLIDLISNATSVNTTGHDVDYLNDLVRKQTAAEGFDQWYKWGAIILAVVIVLLACITLCLHKQFDRLVALFQEAAHIVRMIPSLLIYPFFVVASMMGMSFFFLYLALAIASVQVASIANELEQIGAAFNTTADDAYTQTQKAGLWTVIFGFLWIYYMHVAIFICTTSMAVSQWYFYRNDPEARGVGIGSAGWFPGRPVIVATGIVFWYHLGSLAFGALIVALVTMPRLILEYIVQQYKLEEQNQVTKVLVWVVRCLLWCLHKCVEFITEYAYVYVAITGGSFCGAAQRSFVLIAKYPVQAALDKMASTILGYLVCFTVPLSMVFLSFLMVQNPEDSVAVAVFTFGLAFVTTRLAVGVYDIVVTALFVCVMRDCEHYGGRYMEDLDGLRRVFDSAAKPDEIEPDREDSLELTEQRRSTAQQRRSTAHDS
jgi:hypothetical protein